MNLRDFLHTIRRKLFRKRFALEAELTTLRDEHAHTVTELGTVRSELSQTREQDARQVVDLQQQLFVVKSERKAAQDHVQLLETSLADATARQQGAEQQVQSLESRLDETRSRHEANLGQTQETLRQLQSEQQDLQTLQTDLAKTFHQVGKQMLESAQTRTPQPRLSPLQSAMLGLLLFFSGALLSVLVMRAAVPAVDLAPLHDSMIDLQQLMRMQVESYDELLNIFKESLNRETAVPDAPLDSPDKASDSPDARLTPGRLLERQRADLALLGFEAANDVEAALAQFRMLYLPVAHGKPEPSSDEVDKTLGYYADLARKDSAKYRLDSDILGAIRLASKRTGVEFGFLMELAATESSFNPQAAASTSTAVGLYQFKENTWLDTIKAYGHKYGLDAIRQRINYTVDSKGVRQPTISDPDQLAAALDLRLQPRLSALLAAEYVR
ncbi:MAG: transglycosylase SLT domain-containing protein, partial [Gammaproteobacteria bacterium]